MAARASIIACLTRESVSFGIAWSSVASAFGSRDLNTAWAAERRRAGSGDISVRLPIEAATSPRSRLLSRTGERSAGGVPVTGWPVAASNSLSAASR